MLKLRTSSKSPRSPGSRVESPCQKNTQERYHTEVFKTHVNTSRSIDEVKKKLEMMSSKGGVKMTGKYFKKEADIPSKL